VQAVPMGAILSDYLTGFHFFHCVRKENAVPNAAFARGAAPCRSRRCTRKKKEKIASSDCTLCFRCVEMCPEKDALKVGLFKFPIARSQIQKVFTIECGESN